MRSYLGTTDRFLANVEQTPYVLWARWFFQDGASRAISPSSATTLPEYVRRRIEDDTTESLHEASLLSSTNALGFARLAQQLIATNQTGGVEALKDADWFSRYATNLAPNAQGFFAFAVWWSKSSVTVDVSKSHSRESVSGKVAAYSSGRQVALHRLFTHTCSTLLDISRGAEPPIDRLRTQRRRCNPTQGCSIFSRVFKNHRAAFGAV